MTIKNDFEIQPIDHTIQDNIVNQMRRLYRELDQLVFRADNCHQDLFIYELKSDLILIAANLQDLEKSIKSKY